jgi:hypothetical protein
MKSFWASTKRAGYSFHKPVSLIINTTGETDPLKDGGRGIELK